MLIVILSWQHYPLQIAWQLDHFHNIRNVSIHDQYICWRLLDYSFLLGSVSEKAFIHHRCISWRFLNKSFLLHSLQSFGKWFYIHQSILSYVADRIKYKKKQKTMLIVIYRLHTISCKTCINFFLNSPSLR